MPSPAGVVAHARRGGRGRPAGRAAFVCALVLRQHNTQHLLLEKGRAQIQPGMERHSPLLTGKGGRGHGRPLQGRWVREAARFIAGRPFHAPNFLTRIVRLKPRSSGSRGRSYNASTCSLAGGVRLGGPSCIVISSRGGSGLGFSTKCVGTSPAYVAGNGLLRTSPQQCVLLRPT